MFRLFKQEIAELYVKGLYEQQIIIYFIDIDLFWYLVAIRSLYNVLEVYVCGYNLIRDWGYVAPHIRDK